MENFEVTGRPSSCKLSALKKKKNAVEHVNSVLKGFRDHYSALLEKLVKMLPGPPNKYSLAQLLNIMDM